MKLVPGHRVAADADARGDADALLLQLVERLVGERARAAHDADRARPALGDLAGGDADVALAGADDAGAVRAEQPRARGSRARSVLKTRASSWAGMPSVMHTMNADAGLGRFEDRGRRGLRRHDDERRGRRRSRPPRRRPMSNTGMPSTSVPPLPGRDAGDDLGAVVPVAQAVEAALPPVRPWQMTLVFSSTKMVMSVASVRRARRRRGRRRAWWAWMMQLRSEMPASARISRPSSALVPSRRITIGASQRRPGRAPRRCRWRPPRPW